MTYSVFSFANKERTILATVGSAEEANAILATREKELVQKGAKPRLMTFIITGAIRQRCYVLDGVKHFIASMPTEHANKHLEEFLMY